MSAPSTLSSPARTQFRLRDLNGRRRLAVALALGVVSALALPPLHVLPALLLAVPGLLALLPVRRTFPAFWVGVAFGLGHHVVGLYWVTEAILFEAARFWWLVPLAVPALAFVLALFIGAATAVACHAGPGWRRGAALAGAWVFADLLRQFVATGFPWNPWGGDWAIPGSLGDIMIQPAAWIGVHGLTLLTLLIAAAPMAGRRSLLAAIAALVVWAGFGAWRLSGSAPDAPDIGVVLVQGNISLSEKHNRERAIENFRRYLALTQDGVIAARKANPGREAIAVWPESASPFLLDSDPGAREAVADAARAIVLAGSVRFDANDKPRNSLLAILPDSAVAATYDKWHLVPFGEYAPGWLPVAFQLVPGGGFAPGGGPHTLRVPGLPPFAPLICYEAIFPAQVVDAEHRAAWMVNITNDGWFGNSTGPRQHLAAARLRAVEEGLPLMRAANTGISAGFDAFGRELGRIGMQQPGTLTLSLPGSLSPTPFARLGLAIPAALATLSLGIGLASRRPRAEAPPENLVI